ncbi:slit homolog 1 protein-like, partial [Plectropomus leopardus]|uniref:slit homolog 1 protein-like n=1 Tax=Plectropomus leopardus TaxID=160734 RepID=UPI001C4D827E
MGGLSLHLKQTLVVLLQCLLLCLDSSLAFSLKNCSIGYSVDASAEVVLDCSYHQLVAIPDDVPRDAVIVKLSYNALQQVNREDFGNMSKLRILYLQSNAIAQVDDGSFMHLVALTRLYISDNKLTNLTAHVFQGLSSLTFLDLDRNEIRFIHTSAFQSLSSLQTVLLHENKLRQVSDIQPILQLPRLQTLSIGQNLFPSFQTKDLLLNGSSSLKTLDVSSNKFEKFSITTRIFPHLETIDFSWCDRDAGMRLDVPDKTLMKSITRLYFNEPTIAFEDIRKILQSLDSLTHLRFNYVDEWIQKGLLETVCKIPTLRTLELYYNHAANLSAKLVACSQLGELDLSHTYMQELSNGSIRLMKQLKNLTVAANFLNKVPDDIRSLSLLEILNLGSNLISELSCKDFRNSTRLTKLYLNDNRIAKLDRCVFMHLSDLKVLDMSDNLLWMLGGVFKTSLQKLEFLYLKNNFVPFLKKGDFQGLESVKYLDLVSTHISRVKHKAFDGLTSLRTLRVSLPLEFENKFRGLRQLENLTVYFFVDGSFKSPNTSFNKSFFNLKYLKVFTMICRGDHFGFPFDIPSEVLQAMKHLEDFTAENAYISSPDMDTFQFNPQLKNLTITQTDLSVLYPELFQPISNLHVLDLSETKLKSLDFLSQVNLSALRFLKLSDNEITVINATVFKSLPALTYLDLDNNPFTCDCSNTGFIQWVKNNNQTQVVNAYQYACSFPVAE